MTRRELVRVLCRGLAVVVLVLAVPVIGRVVAAKVSLGATEELVAMGERNESLVMVAKARFAAEVAMLVVFCATAVVLLLCEGWIGGRLGVVRSELVELSGSEIGPELMCVIGAVFVVFGLMGVIAKLITVTYLVGWHEHREWQEAAGALRRSGLENFLLSFPMLVGGCVLCRFGPGWVREVSGRNG